MTSPLLAGRPAVVTVPAFDIRAANPDVPVVRPGSRLARLAVPRSVDVVKQLAADFEVCTRPVTLRRTDVETGRTEIVDIRCGATLEAKCPACAAKAVRLRQRQIREGWHRDDEPLPEPGPPTDDQVGLLVLRAHLEFQRAQDAARADWAGVAECDSEIGVLEEQIAATGLRGRAAPPHTDDGQTKERTEQRRRRSTRRRADVPDLPRRPVEDRTVGRVYTAPDGTTWRPSLFLTVTLPSYGKVHTDGTPVDPDSYDYRAAAWDAVHFPRLLDRFWQNLIGSEPASTGWDRSAHGRLWQNSALEVLAAGWRVEPIGFQPSRWRSTGALAGASSSHLAWVILRGSTSFTVVV